MLLTMLMLQTGSGGLRALRIAGAGLLLAALLGACEAPFDVEAAERFDPLPSYSQWWVELEECVGLERDFDRIRWYVGESIVVEDQPAYGLWVAPDMIIMKRFYITSETAVKHEMLHHLSHGSLPHDHPTFARCTVAQVPDSAACWTVDPAIGAR
ncbi:MAG: hypothetical protein JSW71_02080 [Gemmatimonadota bacterium]|nr:MAG: hypothetical protein JSW71_02080 [Gemmatimonadota bacterium]